MIVYYQNSNGNKINLTQWPIMIQEPETLFGHEWSYTSTEGSYGVKISHFSKGLIKKSATLSIFAADEEEFKSTLNGMHEVFEYDIKENQAGKLYINDQYLSCWCFAAEYSEFEEYFEATDIEISIVATAEKWITEISKTFHISDIESDGNKRYPNRYAHRYANGITRGFITNDGIFNADFQLIIYGATSNPVINISGHQYQVHVAIYEDEYLVIDSQSGTVVKHQGDGTKVNCFDERDKENNLFKLIPPGSHTVDWSGSFRFDLILYVDRSEPKWK